MVEIRQKISSWLLFIFLFLIPTQLGKHFWPDWSYILGIRIDFLSPTLYFLDLIWIGLFLINFSFEKIKRILKWEYFLLTLFVGINLLVAENKGVAVYRWLIILQIIWTINFLKSQKNEVKKYLFKIIPVWIIGESILGLSQMVSGGSLDGIWYFLGERNFNINTVGIAQMSIFGKGILRAYGTFSHPNSLAGFVLLSLVLWIRFKSKIKNKVWWWTVCWFGILGIIISGSRLIWFLALILGYYFCWQKIKNKKKAVGITLISLGVLMMLSAVIINKYPLNNLIGGWDKESFSKRWDLNVAAFKMIRGSLWTGEGLGNFIVELPRYEKNNSLLQPVHNILLLIVSETGLLGLGLLGLSLINFYKNKVGKISDKLILILILISGMWDHYWITLPQNWWLLTVVLGII